MKKIIFILILLLLAFVSGCGEELPEDVCERFEYTVDLCWCSYSFGDPLLYETYIPIENEQGAIDAVNVYLAELLFEQEIDDLEVINAVKLNDYFYNVFVENELGEEITYTVSTEGEIIYTTCGV